MLVSNKHKMEESTRDEVDSNETENRKSTVAKLQKLIQDGCGCRRGLKGGQCSDHFTEETVLKREST